MQKSQIQQLLSHQKINSISDIVNFVIQQVSKSVNFDPLQEIHYRLNDLQKPKGLDSIMIQQVKTIAEAMLDQRQFSIRRDIDKNINDHFQKIQYLIERNMQANSRLTLTQLDINNYQNTKNSRSNMSMYQSKNIFASQKNFNLDQKIQSLYNDQFSTKKELKDQKKDIQELKTSLKFIQKGLSQKVNLQQTQKIMNRFQIEIFQKLNKEKIQWQKLQFKIMKQINEEILQIRKQIKDSPVFKEISEEIQKTKLKIQKYEKKIKKYSQQGKSTSKKLVKIQNSIQIFQKQSTSFSKALSSSQELIKKIQNDTLKQIQQLQEYLEQISQKLNFFDKIQQLNTQIINIKEQTKRLSELNIKGLWFTQMKLKNSMICWQEEIIHNKYFKFQSHKSQILVDEPGIYKFSLMIKQNKNKSSFFGHLMISSQPNQKHQMKIQAKLGANTATKIIQIKQRSFISIKIEQSESFSNGAYFQINKI